MALDTDPVLKQLVQQQLASNGILSKIKAQLRAHVFLALEDNSEFKKKFTGCTAHSAYLSTDHGTVAVSLVREFLEQLGLEFTLSVFDSEISGETPQAYLSRTELSNRMGCGSEGSEPILSQIVRSGGRTNSVPVTPQNPLNSTYVKPDETPDQSIQSVSTQSVEEEAVEDDFGSNDGRITPTNNLDAEHDKSVNLLMFTPVAPKKTKETDSNIKDINGSKSGTSKETKSSPLGDLPPLMTSSSSHTTDIKRLLNEGLATLSNQNNTLTGEDGPSLSSIESQSEGGISTADETASRLSDADVTDTISV